MVTNLFAEKSRQSEEPAAFLLKESQFI